MTALQQLWEQYGNVDCRDLGSRQLEQLRHSLRGVAPNEITCAKDGKLYIDMLKKFREGVVEADKLHGENYPMLLNSLLTTGEDGLYSDNLRFIFELIQNVDDCDYRSPDDCRLDMRFDINSDEIILTYNEVGFTPFNVFAITGIAEAAKNISSAKNEIGEKGIGFKSVFGVAEKVLIRSGWFSFELYKDSFTIPISSYRSFDYCAGTQMTLYVPKKVEEIYGEIKKRYCRKDALFSRNPLLFLNKLTSLRMYFDSWRSMQFTVSRAGHSIKKNKVAIERDVVLSVNLHDYENGTETDVREQINCTRYSLPVVFSRKACQSRYGEQTQIGNPNGKSMILRVVLPNPECVSDVGMGSLYSFLPTQLRLTVPLVCHIPFKLDASREFVDPQGNNLWFKEASGYLSELIDQAYLDWRYEVKEDIVRYIPGIRENLFANNNGKEQCLSRLGCFSGSHYLNLPLFYTIDGSYHSADEIFCFDQGEKIGEPEKVFRLMEFRRYLFCPSAPVSKFGFETERDIKNRLFRRAFTISSITFEALEYLDSADYIYSENTVFDQIANITSYMSPKQIETMLRHSKLAEVLQSVGCKYVRKKMRMWISLTDAAKQNLKDALYVSFELSEAPKQVEEYMRLCGEKCACLDIEECQYLPCSNAVILSKKNPLASFATFCYDIDQRDTFAIRVKLREASSQLNRCVENGTGSPEDFLRDLRNIRLSIKDSLGSDGYRSYIDLILKSGTDKGRFIQELLQNADDCNYPRDAVPSFSLTQRGNTVLTEYNEKGFTRANIRSITAIGESTKNRLFNNQNTSIGEKGVGFKTIFAVASEVRIFSGEYAFSLTDREPTIPKALGSSAKNAVSGTRMEITLKDRSIAPVYDEKTILQLCLCLRKLRSITIGSHTVSIEDSDQRRTRVITVDKKQYVFKRFVHTFNVTDKEALKERRNGTRDICEVQSIICFVPEKGGLTDYALYNGLPTKHRIKIPMAIDAPFALTTSREEIETESSAWNAIVREELYNTIISIIHSLKMAERAKVFRFTRFVPRLRGVTHTYDNDISDCDYLTDFNFLAKLKSSEILPTFNRAVFKAPQSKDAYRFPDAAAFLFSRVSQSEYAGIQPSGIIDVSGKEYEAALNAMECAEAPFSLTFTIIRAHAKRFIQQDEFRSKLYELLQDAPAWAGGKIKELAIIPVYGRTPGNVEYISWKEDSIFVKKGTSVSGENYYILNEELMSKTACETIFGANINEMNAEWERSRYNDRLSKIIRGKNVEEIYNYLMSEYQSGRLQRNESFATLYALTGAIPMKNDLGEIVDTELFLCNKPSNYFSVDMIRRLIVHKECADFAKYMRCTDLCDIHYDEVDYYEPLTADDVESLLDDYFENSDDILRGFYRNGLLPDDLIGEYELEYLTIGRTSDFGESYQFPSDPIVSRTSLANHVREQWQNPVRLVAVREERTVHKGKSSDGKTFDLRIQDAREGALRVYSPSGAKKQCFCQMCRKVKPQMLIEVNNIEVEPRYYFPQLRIALCLECSKHFEFMRNNKNIRTEFINAILNTDIQNQGAVDIRIGKDNTIRFTAKHLAEIQEILRQMPSNGSAL